MDAKAHSTIHDRRHLVGEMMSPCRICPRRCGVDRMAGEKGFCGLDSRVYCFREMMHPAEEKELVPSHQVYFAGCNLQCGYCSVGEWNEDPWDFDPIEPDELVWRIEERRAHGAKTLNLLGGEPTVSLYGILGIMGKLDPAYRVVWNSNMYFSDEVHGVLAGLADVFLADMKCGNSTCSESILQAKDYFDVARDTVKKASGYADVILRHLVLPGHLECCCRPVLEWAMRELPLVKVSLRLDYMPPADKGDCPAGTLSGEERARAVEMAKDFGLNLIQ